MRASAYNKLTMPLKPILDELNDKLESFEGEPTPADHRWLRGQLRKPVDRLDMP
jgi:hypothetical protein